MLQRLIGVAVGAVATFLVLWFCDLTNYIDSNAIPVYAIAAAVGAVTSFLWPVVISWWLASRATERRDDKIQKEVQRQLAEEQKKD